MIITDLILDKYKKLYRHKNTWGFNFEVNGVRTRFEIVKNNNDYLIYIHQNHISKGVYKNTILLGVVLGTEDLEDCFLSITRGEYL